jgi:hypothetical protein
MPYSVKPTLEWWRDLMEANRWLVQFGQSDDSLTENGSSGCTDTVLQALILGWKAKRVTHNQIRKAAGRGIATCSKGLTADDVRKVIANWGLPYKVVFGMTWGDVLRASNRGPAIVATRYANWPNWAHYGGATRPKPWARPTDKAGRSQFSGFTGAHANLLLGYANWLNDSGVVVRVDAFVKEPNHGSPARPERPPYDIVLSADGKAAYDAYKSVLGRELYAVIPTTTFRR